MHFSIKKKCVNQFRARMCACVYMCRWMRESVYIYILMCLYVYNCVCPCTRVYAFTFVCIGVCVYRYVRACMNRSVTVYTTGMRIFQRVCVYVQLCVYACFWSLEISSCSMKVPREMSVVDWRMLKVSTRFYVLVLRNSHHSIGCAPS